MSKKKYKYQSYDYSKLKPKDSWYVPMARKVYAKLIGNELNTVRPMSAPLGQLYWFDYTTVTNTDSSTITTVTYSPNTYRLTDSITTANNVI